MHSFLKVLIDLLLIFLLKIVFDLSIWFHFEITLILLSPFAKDMQIWAFSDPSLVVMTAELGFKLQIF